MLSFKRTILLTGAGFSKNFGGYLGREMWAKIFNHPALEQILEIKNQLRSKFDFESVYADVLKNSDLTDQEKKGFQKIVLDAYDDMDQMLKQYIPSGDDPYQVNFHGVRGFLGLFAGSSSEVGLHFTLNQDLFLERMVHSPALGLGTLRYKDYRDTLSGGSSDDPWK